MDVPAAARPQTGEARRLGVGLLILLALLAFEIIGALLSGSLALLGDAGHVLMDAVALGGSFVAARMALRRPTPQFTFGFARLEILVAFANGLALFAIALTLTGLGIWRLLHPTRVEGGIMLAFAAVGLVANLAIMVIFRSGLHGRLNIESAFWHILGDTLSSVLVVAGGVLVATTGESRVDAVASFTVAALNFFGATRLVTRAGRILLEGAAFPVDDVAAALTAVPGVSMVHHIHLRTLTDGIVTLTARVHPVGDPRLSECGPLLGAIEAVLKERFGIRHATIQFEVDDGDRAVSCVLGHD